MENKNTHAVPKAVKVLAYIVVLFVLSSWVFINFFKIQETGEVIPAVRPGVVDVINGLAVPLIIGLMSLLGLDYNRKSKAKHGVDDA